MQIRFFTGKLEDEVLVDKLDSTAAPQIGSTVSFGGIYTYLVNDVFYDYSTPEVWIDVMMTLK